MPKIGVWSISVVTKFKEGYWEARKNPRIGTKIPSSLRGHNYEERLKDLGPATLTKKEGKII